VYARNLPPPPPPPPPSSSSSPPAVVITRRLESASSGMLRKSSSTAGPSCGFGRSTSSVTSVRPDVHPMCTARAAMAMERRVTRGLLAGRFSAIALAASPA